MTRTDYLVLQKNLLRIVGVSFKENENVWYNLYSVVIIGLILGIPISLLHSIFVNEHTLDILLENLALIAATTTASVKLLAIFRVRKQLGKTLQILQSGVFIPNIERGGPEEEMLIKQCTFYNTFQLIILLSLSTASISISVVQTLIPRVTHSNSTYWSLPYGTFSLFDVTYSPNFDIVWLYQVLFIGFVSLAIITATTFIAGVMAHVSYQCKMLQNFIRKCIVYSEKKMKQGTNIQMVILEVNIDPSEIHWKYLKQTLKEIIEYHTAIIDLASKFEEFLNIPALIDFLGISVGICTALFSCTVLPTFNIRLLKQVILACANTFLQFITAYWGNEVILTSEGVAKASCEVNFIGADVKFQKSWVVIMQRSQRRIQFTVGKFAPLSLDSFVKVLQTAYSYFMVLYNVSEEKAVKD